MDVIKWRWHGQDICLDLCQRNNNKGRAWSEHSHEYYEVFWIEEGYCLHRLNGEETLLGRGDIVFLSPGDVHSGDAVKADLLIHINLSLETSTLERIKEQYKIEDEHWPWSPQNRKRKYTLSTKQIMILRNLRESIDSRSKLDHDLFVLHLLKFFKDPFENDLVNLPKWLQQSLRTFHENRLYGRGVSGLAEISGYSREYISRTIKKKLNRSATDLLSDMRFEGVLNLLRHTDYSILDITDEFDFKSTAYFYKCFKKKYGETPGKYRNNYRSRLIDSVYY